MAKRPTHFSEDPTALITNFKRVKTARSVPLTEGRTYSQLYHNRPAVMASATATTQIIDAQGLRDLGFNVLAEAADGALSQIAKPLRCVAAPIGGSHRQRLAAAALGKVITGVMEMNNWRRLAARLTLNAAFWPETHALWEVDPVTKDLRCLELDPHETFVSSDRTEVVTARCVPRRWLMAVFGDTPELRDAIDGLRPYTPEHLTGVDAMDMFGAEDNVCMYMGWTLPIGKLPGKHVIQLSRDVVIEDKEWTIPVLPVVSTRWSEGHRGLSDGKPMGRAVAPFMTWETELRLKTYNALTGAVPWVKSKQDPEISDAPYQWVKEDEDTGPVSVEVPKVLSSEVTETADGLREAAMRRAGVSEDAAAGSAPPQFKSGVALAQWVAIVNTRLSQQHQSYEDLWTQSGRIIAYLGKDAYKGKPVNVRTAIGSEDIEQVEWPDLPEKSYSLMFKVVSALGDTIPQQLENLQIAKEFGVISTEEMWAHVDIPDFAGRVERINGPINYIEFQIDRALNDGVVEPPIREMQNLEELNKAATQAYLAMLAKRVRPPRNHQEALRVLARLAKRGAATVAPAATDDLGATTDTSAAVDPLAPAMDPAASAPLPGTDPGSAVEPLAIPAPPPIDPPLV